MTTATRRAGRRASRRTAAQKWALLGVLGVVALAIAACGGDEDAETVSGAERDAATDAATAPTTGLPDLSGVKISYVGFGGVVDEMVEKVWMKPFSEATGAEFVIDSPTDFAKIETQVKSGNVSVDVVDAISFIVAPACGTVYEPLDISQDDVLPEYRLEDKCSVPNYVGIGGIAYSTEAFPDGGPETCADFFDTERFPGTRAVSSSPVAFGILECAAIADGADPTDPYPIDLDAATARIRAIGKDLKTFDSQAQTVDGMVNGDAPIYMNYQRNFIDAVNKDAPYAASTGFAWSALGSYAIPKGAPNKEAAEVFLEYISRPEVNRLLPEALPPYRSPTGGAVPEAWPDSAKTLNVFEAPLARSSHIFSGAWWGENIAAATERYTDAIR